MLQADGRNAAAHLNLGVAYKGQGQYDKAMQEYDEAEKLDPSTTQTRWPSHREPVAVAVADRKAAAVASRSLSEYCLQPMTFE